MTAPLAWLIDANVISEMMRPQPEPRVSAFLDSKTENGLGLASITVWEILNGIGRLDPGRHRRVLPVRITRSGMASVVLIALDDFASREETNYLLRSPGNAERLRAAIAELDAGNGKEHIPVE